MILITFAEFGEQGASEREEEPAVKEVQREEKDRERNRQADRRTDNEVNGQTTGYCQRNEQNGQDLAETQQNQQTQVHHDIHQTELENRIKLRWN